MCDKFNSIFLDDARERTKVGQTSAVGELQIGEFSQMESHPPPRCYRSFEGNG